MPFTYMCIYVFIDDSWKKLIAESNLSDNLELVNHYVDDDLDNIDRRNRFRIKYNKYPYNDDLLNHYDSKTSDRYFDSLQYNHFDEQYPSDDMVMEASIPNKDYIRTCIVGIIIDCPTNEECYTSQSKSRSGICNCKMGYVRRETGECEIENERIATSADVKVATTNLQTSSAGVNASNVQNVASTTPKVFLYNIYFIYNYLGYISINFITAGCSTEDVKSISHE